jgi:UDP-glucose 4-epimerase
LAISRDRKKIKLLWSITDTRETQKGYIFKPHFQLNCWRQIKELEREVYFKMQITEAFKGKTLVITGGTGSFGSTVLKHFLTTDIGEIRIISRDEKKQDWMRHTLQAQYPDYAGKVQFYVGDVRNLDSVRDVMYGANYVFHAAALKEVPSCEFFPMEAVRTNIIGTDNVITAAVEAGVQRVVFLSTDKAAYPINTMGMTKAVGEKVVQARAQKAFERGGTVLACTRYGNVMCSRGSVIPLFIDQIKRKAPITITDPNMTRFLMNLDEAVDLVAFAFEHAEPGDLFVQKADASTIGDLADGVMKLFGETEKKIIGTRHSEKLYETLVTREEMIRSVDMGHYYRIVPDARGLNYDKFYVQGTVTTQADEAYTSHNTIRLDVDGVVQKLMSTDYVKEELEGRPHIVEA